VTLIGATTENPYFEVNSALLSRCQLFELQPLDRDDLAGVVRRGETELATTLTDEIRDEIVAAAGGDARNALNILEAAVAAAGGEPVSADNVHDAARKRPLLYDKGGDHHYDVTSAFIKSMRGSDADAAIYYLAVMIAGGEDPKFIARRMIVFASEDVGNADPRRCRWRWPAPVRSSSWGCPSAA
jgi:putative ATPase